LRQVDIELLDGNVALKRIGLIKDASGRRRLARVYNFEFTVTGETRQRHHHPVRRHSAQIELAPYPFDDQAAATERRSDRAEPVAPGTRHQEPSLTAGSQRRCNAATS
jgi:hypothetical protein